MTLSEKFVKKYMRAAKQIADDNQICYSRQLGAVIVKVYPDGTSRQVSGGYNGPPKHTPHCDSEEYLQDVVWPQLTEREREPFEETLSPICAFVRKYAGCKTCPRRIIGAKTGQRTELCSCEHAERNAIYNATEDLYGCWMFGWHGVPCQPCANAVINSGIKKIYVIEDNSYAHGTDYSYSSRWLLRKAGVDLVIYKPEWYLA